MPNRLVGNTKIDAYYPLGDVMYVGGREYVCVKSDIWTYKLYWRIILAMSILPVWVDKLRSEPMGFKLRPSFESLPITANQNQNPNRP